MSSHGTLSDPTSAIFDNNPLHKKSSLLDNHIDKDPAQVLPSITPVRPNVNVSAQLTPNTGSCRPSKSSSRNGKGSQPQNYHFASPLKKRSQNTKLQPLSHYTLFPQGSFSLLDDPSTLATADTYGKIGQSKRSGSTTRNNSKDDMSPQQTIDKARDVIKGLESPLEIYRRVSSQKSESAINGEQTPSKIGMKKLKAIVQKLDLRLEVTETGKDLLMINEMRKIPAEYYQKARMSRRREKSQEKSHDKLADETPKEKPQHEGEVRGVFLKIPSYDEEEEYTQRTNGTKSAAEVLRENDKDETPAKNRENKLWAVCRVGPLLYNKERSMYSSNNLSTRSFMSDANEKVSVRNGSSRGRQKVVALRGKGETTYIKEDENTQRVMNIAKEIIALKSQTNNDLGTLKSHQKKFLKDMDKIKEDSSGISEDQMKIDRDHLEDVLEQIKKRSTSTNNQVTKNFAREGAQLKNKQERNVDNIRFERHMAKVDRKIEAKFRNKASSVNLRKRRYVSDNSCRDL